MSEIILVNITGKDRPGLLTRITGVLAEHDLNVLDIGQAVIHDYISLGLLVEIPAPQQASSMIKDLLFTGHELGIEVRFRPTTLEAYEEWVHEQGKSRYVITLLGRKLSAAQISRVAAVCSANNLNIDVITRLTGRPSLLNPAQMPKASVQMTVSGHLADEAAIRGQLLPLSMEIGVDISFHADDIYRRNRRLVVFDMDSTLIQAEVIDELAKEAGVGAEVSAITAAAMRGELDFRQSLTRRVGLLAGLPATTLETVAARLRLTDGAELVASTLKRLGYKIGIISGGFDYFGRRLQTQLGFDYMHANQLEISEGRLTGRVLGEIIDGPRKAALLREIAAAEGLRLEQTIAVGDGANDLPMLSIAGLGVAFHAKPVVRQQASSAISDMGLDGLLFLIGIREREILLPA
ncbi:Phosphoserine phosphatase SerB:HAD-superfamily hydrolase, subfamily IB (PSPase-like) [Oscillochloris trichoides DG-6]|uniref:phosphoserine phosphatase n=1 Tax=Oscillochloris trichoides DG-6 TaxID=765420 RepID=E1IBY6_9CHLR|nr:phosphoserine phosphatase SerB [Oscillochloris trichoides]EFO81314.1 Phosphoserine phosphatase SerB:HAD-superfamily hydrolase, subfamily IB (PSPase-like) [Oscillochloris trichoides DG-6]